MPRRPIPFVTGEYYHLYNRGNNRELIFRERTNYQFFLYRMQQCLCPETDIIAYCLMPTHYHLLVQLKTPDLSQAMQSLSLSYTKAFNTKYGRIGVLFQGPFQARHIGKNSYLLHLSAYLHLNPVLSNLVRKSEEWEFSSYRDYLGLRKNTFVEAGIVLNQFDTQEGYQQFVEKQRNQKHEEIQVLLLE